MSKATDRRIDKTQEYLAGSYAIIIGLVVLICISVSHIVDLENRVDELEYRPAFTIIVDGQNLTQVSDGVYGQLSSDIVGLDFIFDKYKCTSYLYREQDGSYNCYSAIVTENVTYYDKVSIK